MMNTDICCIKVGTVPSNAIGSSGKKGIGNNAVKRTSMPVIKKRSERGGVIFGLAILLKCTMRPIKINMGSRR
jgi:hypothetical protein